MFDPKNTSFSKRLTRICWVALSALYLLLGFQNMPGVLTNKGVILNDSDPYYRLVRIESIATEKWVYPLNDRRLEYPKGFHVPWPLGLDYLIALPLKAFEVKSQALIAAISATSIPFLAFPIFVLTCLSLFLLSGSQGFAMLSGLMVMLFPFVMYQSGIGRIDHHFLEALFCVSALCGFLAEEQHHNKYTFWGLVLLLGLAPSFWPQAWIIGPMMGLAFLGQHRMTQFSRRAYVFIFAALMHTGMLALSGNFLSGSFSLFGFSWWTSFGYFGLASVFGLLSWIRKESQSLRCFSVALSGLSLVSSFLLWRNGALTMGREIQSTGQALVRAPEHLTASTLEARHLYQLPAILWLKQGLYMIPLACFSSIFFLLKRKYIPVILFAAIPLILSWIQVRFVTMTGPVGCVLVTMLLYELYQMLTTKRWIKTALVSFLAIVILFPFRPHMGWTHYENSHPFFSSIVAFGQFSKKEEKMRPLSPELHSIMAHWDYGHWLLYYTSFNVVAHPFQTPLSQKVSKMFVSDDFSQLDQFAEKHNVQYVLTEFSPKRFHRWLINSGKNPDPYIYVLKTNQGDHYQIKEPEFFSLNVAKFYFLHAMESPGNHSGHWRLVFTSPFGSPGYENLTAMKGFEHVKGATIRLKNAKDHHLQIQAPIEYIYDKSFVFSQNGVLDGEDLVWTVPYASFDRGGVFFDGYYHIIDKNGKEHAKVGPIQEQEIIHGEEITVY
ncbi:MAG: hypothetical protein R3A11_07120 [Bdellovibrionota bacterium]